MASLKPFDESRKITVCCEKTCQALFLFFEKITLSSNNFLMSFIPITTYSYVNNQWHIQISD